MFSKVLFAIAAAAVAVNAQSASVTGSAPAASSSILAGISPCVLACVGPAATLNGCSSFADITCICRSAGFVADATTCLQAHCTSADLAAAVQLQQSQCAAASLVPTGSATTTHSIPFSTGAAGSATGSASAASGSHAASSASGSHSSAAGSGSAASGSASATSPASSSTAKPSSAAGAIVANSGVAAFFGAVLAGALAL